MWSNKDTCNAVYMHQHVHESIKESHFVFKQSKFHQGTICRMLFLIQRK